LAAENEKTYFPRKRGEKEAFSPATRGRKKKNGRGGEEKANLGERSEKEGNEEEEVVFPSAS